MSENKKLRKLSEDELENVNGGYMDFTVGSCSCGGEHDWVLTGVTREASQCQERYKERNPDKQIQCNKCKKSGWKIFTRDCRWVYSYDD